LRVPYRYFLQIFPANLVIPPLHYFLPRNRHFMFIFFRFSYINDCLSLLRPPSMGFTRPSYENICFDPPPPHLRKYWIFETLHTKNSSTHPFFNGIALSDITPEVLDYHSVALHSHCSQKRRFTATFSEIDLHRLNYLCTSCAKIE